MKMKPDPVPAWKFLCWACAEGPLAAGLLVRVPSTQTEKASCDNCGKRAWGDVYEVMSSKRSGKK